MTNLEKALLFGNVGASALGAVAGSRQQNQNQQQQEADLRVQRMMQALQNKQNTSTELQQNRQQGWKDQTSQSPLGQEQSFLQKQRLAQVLFPQIANFKGAMPTDPAIAGAFKPQTNVLGAFGDPRFLETFGDQATATSLADRRKLMAGLNPDYEFSSLGNFGLDSSFDQGVNRAQQDAAGRRQAYESTQADLANQQYQLAQGQTTQGQMSQNKKGGGVKGFLGGLLKTAAPFAAFIPGIGPAASIAMGAGAGILGGKLQGQSNLGALGSGLMTGAGALGGEALISQSKGMGLNPFNNNVGKVISNVPLGPAANPGLDRLFTQPDFSIPSPTNAAGSIQQQLQQPQSSFRQLPPQQGPQGPGPGPRLNIPPSQFGPGLSPSVAPRGFNPQGYPLANAGPYSGNSQTQMAQDPNYRTAPPELPPPAQRAFEDIMNSGLGRGYSEGPWNIGGATRGALQAIQTVPKGLPAGPQLASGPRQPQLGPGPQPPRISTPNVRGQLPGGQAQLPGGQNLLPSLSQSSQADQQALANIMQQMQRNGNSPQMQAYNVQLNDAAQEIMRRILGGR